MSPTAVYLPTQQRAELPCECVGVAEIKAQASSLCNIPAAHLLLFPCAPIVEDQEEPKGGAALHIAIGHAPDDSALVESVPPLAALLANHRTLVERVNRMRTALALSSEGSLLQASAQLHESIKQAAANEATLRPALDAAELAMRLRMSERRAATAERRVAELERQLAEARRHMPGPSAAATRAPAAEATDEPAVAASTTRLSSASDASRGGATLTTSPAADGRDECDEVLAAIRREKAADVDVPPELAGTVAALRGSLHRSLALLSEDLYREDVHAVSELLQNADDNEYAPGVEPSWTLHCAGGHCWSANNEVGMSAADVRALCLSLIHI